MKNPIISPPYSPLSSNDDGNNNEEEENGDDVEGVESSSEEANNVSGSEECVTPNDIHPPPLVQISLSIKAPLVPIIESWGYPEMQET